MRNVFAVWALWSVFVSCSGDINHTINNHAPIKSSAVKLQQCHEAASYQVKVYMTEWIDKSRKRVIPVKVYYPANHHSEFPLIIFSHGLGGTRENYSYLGRFWAAKGYVSVHPQHLGSDDSVWRPYEHNPIRLMLEMKKATVSPKNILNRPKDISFVIDKMIALALKKSPLQGLIDTNRIGVAGHSFGAYSSMMVAGRIFTFGDGRELFLKDKRVKAVISMSGSAVKGGIKKQLYAYDKITIPVLHMTGSKDFSTVIPDVTPEDRIQAFDYSVNCERYLLNLNNAGHLAFFDEEFNGSHFSDDPRHHKLIKTASLSFFDAWLKGNDDRKVWLDKSFPLLLEKDDIFRIRHKKQ